MMSILLWLSIPIQEEGGELWLCRRFFIEGNVVMFDTVLLGTLIGSPQYRYAPTSREIAVRHTQTNLLRIMLNHTKIFSESNQNLLRIMLNQTKIFSESNQILIVFTVPFIYFFSFYLLNIFLYHKSNQIPIVFTLRFFIVNQIYFYIVNQTKFRLYLHVFSLL